ncbi:MAG: Geranylfarnesyl diphosphate synthase [Methanosaeta sp. PtaB.Bin087]|jgi:geranylgeranyl diphosphate synthase type I|nr:MAG: Geranylfarnesyl diphosphate synthase [Methanosaeta sp. PtaB.Bin087]HOI68724.1 polyprenyl synthetase family protein [Methanothrix sp.]HPY73122.1 polyprenyl synthetase family protein [Methanothrix sp.]
MLILDEELLRRSGMISGAIEELLPVVHPRGLYAAGRHLVDAGGKRLRPSMLLLAAEAVGGDPAAVVPAAVSIELVHNFTLIHDDIMDNAETRRGRPAVHVKWDEAGAILAGDTLYSKAFEILTASAAQPEEMVASVKMLAKTCAAICEGQWLDMEFERRDEVTEAEYLEMIEKKTGVLYGAAAWMGARLAAAPLEQAEGLERFGRLVGMAFQIQDDVLDLTAPAKVLGKPRGGDLAEGKKTLIMIHALAGGARIEIFGKKNASSEDVEAALAALRASGSIDYARNKAVSLVEEGKRALSVLQESEAKTLLLALADYMISRSY